MGKYDIGNLPYRVKTRLACEVLACGRTTLTDWEKKCPRLFAPVKRNRRGNTYRPLQVRLMGEVMDGVIDPQTGEELWERTQRDAKDAIYADAGDPTRKKRN